MFDNMVLNVKEKIKDTLDEQTGGGPESEGEKPEEKKEEKPEEEKKEESKFKKPRKYSESYCKKTSCADMGFTQKASCRPYKNCYK